MIKRISPLQTVLLVEDEPTLRELCRDALIESGFLVLEACDARNAVDVAARHEGVIDLLVTDLVMPGPNGRKLAQALKETRPTIRVLFMSGYIDDLERYGISNEAFNFLEKPFRPSALSLRVGEIFQRVTT